MKKKRPGYVDLTHDVLKQLKDERERTGIGFSKLLASRGGKRKTKVLSSTVHRWVSGAAKSACKEDLDFIFGLYKELPDLGGPMIPMTKEKATFFRAKILETGLSLTKLVNFRDDAPENFDAEKFYRGCTGKTVKSYNKAHGDYVVTVCEEYCSNKKATAKHKRFRLHDDKVEIGMDDLKRMKRYRDQLNLLPGHLFKVANAPQGLTSNMVGAWINGAIKAAKPEHVDWVLQNCELVIKKALDG